jgi:UDP-N-acetylmuramoyl-L-alanyl-D-glutamate--2,6-diaminopimelate ligase
LAKSLTELAEALGLDRGPHQWQGVSVTGVCSDSRKVKPGDLFAVIQGHHWDGRDFVPEAVRRGAVAVIAERGMELPVPVLRVRCARRALAEAAALLQDHPTRELFTVGVTGTNGKTTTCHWIADLFGATTTLASSTVSNAADADAILTTPPSPVLQRMARDAADRGMQHLIIEASSAGIAQDRVGAIDFDAAVFTNFSPEHVRHHRGLASYRQAKLKLFESLKPHAWAILNADDALHSAIAEATPARTLTYGIGTGADLRASDVLEEDGGYRFTVGGPDVAPKRAFLPALGTYNLSNILAAIGVGIVHGLDLDVMIERLPHVRPVPGRAQFLRHPDGRTAVVDFAHNAAALEAVLQLLGTHYAKVIALFGCPGDGEHEKRVAMGRVSGRLAAELILTADNPKNEDAVAIASEIQSGMDNDLVPVTVIPDRRLAVQTAVARARPGEVVLLAGKGHERAQLVGSRRVPFSDIDVLRELGFVDVS